MLIPSKRLLAALAVLCLGAIITSHVYGSTADTVINWYAGRSLPQMTSWTRQSANDNSEILRQGFILSELSQVAYGDGEPNRLARLGFKKRGDTIHERMKVNAKSVGTFVQINGADVVGALIGGSGINDMFADAEALTLDSIDGAVRVVAVRGTEFSSDAMDTLRDGMVDINAATVAQGGVTYHHGFYIYSKLLYDDVRKALGDACAPGGTSVYLTGHSMGGAAAEILALWLQNSGCQVDGVATFAAPLPGKNNMEDAYDTAGLTDITQRWVHMRDPVPCLPLGIGWAQLGQQHTITETSLNMHDTTDWCSLGGDTLEGRVFGVLSMAHDMLDVATYLEDWVESLQNDLGLCSKRSAQRIILGILTLGASEATCKTLDSITDMHSIASQLEHSALLVLEDRSFKKHAFPQCLYNDRIVEEGEASGEFLNPIWQERLEAAWTPSDCPVLPSPKPSYPPEDLHGGIHCPSGSSCCEWIDRAKNICTISGCIDTSKNEQCR